MILDTNALSDFFQDVKALKPHLEQADIVCLPVIVLGEFRFGLKSSKKHRVLKAKLDEFVEETSVLAIEETTTHHYADVRRELKDAGTPIPENDVWIAALVRQHRLPLLSNDQHFDYVKGIERRNW